MSIQNKNMNAKIISTIINNTSTNILAQNTNAKITNTIIQYIKTNKTTNMKPTIIVTKNINKKTIIIKTITMRT